MEILDKITNFAMKWEGIEELPGNGGWKNKEFQDLMEEVGWQKGWPWCAAFCKMIYYNVFKQVSQSISDWIMNDFTASATETYEICEQSPRWTTIIKQPVEGSVVCWQHGNSWKGHEGIVIEPGAGEIDSYFKSLEGNTDDSGSRLGIKVALRTRRNNFTYTEKEKGLHVIGFITPPVPLEKLNSKTIKL